MAPKSVTFRRHDHLVSVLFAQPFLQHYIFNVFGSCKEKFARASTSRSQILTVLPKTWSIKKVQEEFGASNFIARKAKQLVQEKGNTRLKNRPYFRSKNFRS